MVICIAESTVQGYECQVVVKAPNGKYDSSAIAVDACLAIEIIGLWDRGIKTIGSCCGKHINCKKDMSYIQVIKEDIKKMEQLGYMEREHDTDKTRKDLFIPKSI